MQSIPRVLVVLVAAGAWATTADAQSRTLAVAPETSTLAAVGATVQLTVTATERGQPVQPSGVRWTSLSPGVATVDPGGLVIARAGGTARIEAVWKGAADTATVTVQAAAPTQPAPTPAPVASVSVTPPSDTLDVGGTVQLAATLRDANGNTLTGRTVTWSSSAAGVATVSSSGLVTGVAAGAATITATSEGQSGTSRITVAAPAAAPPPSTGGALANECASPKAGWIWCDDFDQDRLSRYFEYQTGSGSFTRAAGVGAGGSYGMKARWSTAGQVGAGALHLAFGRTPSTYFRPVDAGTANYREIYWRVYVRNEPAWSGGGGYKFTRAMVLASSNWAQAMIAHHWSGGSTTFGLNLDPATGTDDAGNLRTTTYNDFNNLRWLGAVKGINPVFDASHVGQWYCVEAHVRLNDAGQANGIFEAWINGTLDARKTGINWLGSYNAYGINAVFVENYWNGGAPRAQERYFDNFVVSTQPIGCPG